MIERDTQLQAKQDIQRILQMAAMLGIVQQESAQFFMGQLDAQVQDEEKAPKEKAGPTTLDKLAEILGAQEMGASVDAGV